MKSRYDVAVIGGGPAGLAAAISAREKGAESVLILERAKVLGGILPQCIHNGFGLHYFKQELTGPEYAERFIRRLAERRVEALTGAMALSVLPDRTIYAIHPEEGYMTVKTGAIVLAMGCRERTRGALGIPGSRPAGVFTAGSAQLYMNIEGCAIGSRAVILGSGDIGLIMARRLTLEGAEVLGVFEALPYPGGLTRNIVQCLNDFNIPLHLSHTVIDIRGDKRVEQVVVAQVDENRRPVPGTERVIDCDTLLLSVGLIPENELSRQAGIEIDGRTNGPAVYENMETSLPGVFAAGNVAHVHDLADYVTLESIRAGAGAAQYALGQTVPDTGTITVKNGPGVRYTVPQYIRPGRVGKGVEIFFRPTAIFAAVTIEAASGGATLVRFARDRMTPGEMEKIVLPEAFLAKAKDEITVSVRQTVPAKGAS
ncbi:MAG: NAD(P)/FAD-dependent oxidoreductase [Treponema sp.]|jgi:NADPH-dependent 2,4-dienoyl-CoA reductase/sulfur reductase-like enzyme|nr:NAD(P)/FAD-dependent oxidoreductase [Treponema sp.]